MPKYVKAYLAKDLRQFAGWAPAERPREARADAPDAPHDDEEILYLHEDYTVRDDAVEDAPAIFPDAGQAWREFCRDFLGFRVPDWEAEAAAVRRELEASGELGQSAT